MQMSRQEAFGCAHQEGTLVHNDRVLGEAGVQAFAFILVEAKKKKESQIKGLAPRRGRSSFF